MVVQSQFHCDKTTISTATRHIYRVPAHTYTNIHTHHITCTCAHIWTQTNMCTCEYILWAMHMCTCNILQHMYTCEHIFLMLLRLTVHIHIRAKIYIMAYHLLFDFTKPYSGRPPHRANIGQAQLPWPTSTPLPTTSSQELQPYNQPYPPPPPPSHCLLNEDVVEDNEQDPPLDLQLLPPHAMA